MIDKIVKHSTVHFMNRTQNYTTCSPLDFFFTQKKATNFFCIDFLYDFAILFFKTV